VEIPEPVKLLVASRRVCAVPLFDVDSDVDVCVDVVVVVAGLLPNEIPSMLARFELRAGWLVKGIVTGNRRGEF